MTEQQLCMLTVHAHPDDEASKGAPTLAMYHAQGVHTVLVCCTGGEEGDLQNPALRERGQPFHGLTPEQEKAKLAELRPVELAGSARDHRVRRGRHARLPGLGHARHRAEPAPRVVPHGADRRGHRAARRGHPPRAPAGHHHLQRRPGGYPHPDHLKVHDISVLAFERAGDPDVVPRARRAVPAAKLYYTVWSRARMLAIHEAMIRSGTSPYDEKWLDRPDRDHRITTKLDVGAYLWARPGRCVPTPPRSTRTSRGGSASTDDELANAYPYEEWVLAHSTVGRPEPGYDRDRPVRRLRDPAPRRVALWAGTTVQYRVVFGKKDEVVEGPDDAELVVTWPLADAGLGAASRFMRGT